jgi:hypothetical protein
MKVIYRCPTNKMKTSGVDEVPADSAVQRSPEKYRMLKFVAGFYFRLHPVLLAEGSILRALGVTSLITVRACVYVCVCVEGGVVAVRYATDENVGVLLSEGALGCNIMQFYQLIPPFRRAMLPSSSRFKCAGKGCRQVIGSYATSFESAFLFHWLKNQCHIIMTYTKLHVLSLREDAPIR